MDANNYRPALDSLPLWAPRVEPGSRVQFPAPTAPGSETSREAGEAIDATGQRQREVTRCLQWFAAQTEPRTRNQLAGELYCDAVTNEVSLGSACARVFDLVTMGWVQEVGRKGKRATLSITDAGRKALNG